MPEAVLSATDIDALAQAQASEQQPQALFSAIEQIAALMFSLGVRSIVNVPVVWRDDCLGVLNFACPLQVVEAHQVAAARLVALTAVAGFLDHTVSV